EIAVEKILSPSDDDRLVLVQGPPGTGKTTDIAAAVTSSCHRDPSQPIWIAAQSNVAVKNIAEKLSDVGFDNFRLLVSKDFHLECMLSNPAIAPYIYNVPVKTIIFDEASQNEVGDYLPIIHRFGETRTKMVFIRDQKQLAPYGQEEIRSLESVFEFDYLFKQAIFLDIQYRLPYIIGDFIS
ncbi:hypothetical protein ID866_9317, partial [Astraeus odoratus]